jgi:hypothetical protein
MKKIKYEWEKYQVGIPSIKNNWVNKDCMPYKKVRHISHVKDALRIIEDGIIRSSLVWDKSRLNNSRTCVSWVSPNSWGNGSLYGNVSFEFDWDRIVDGKDLYWVEAVTDYQPAAYRILISEKKHDSIPELQLYNERKPYGPIYFDGETWYRNGFYTGEFLIDSDLSLRDCSEIDFVDHNDRICTKSNACSDIGSSSADKGAELLATLIGRDINKSRKLFIEDERKGKFLTTSSFSALHRLFLDLTYNLSEDGMDKGLKFRKGDIYRILRAALMYYGLDELEEARKLINLIGSKKRVIDSLVRIVSDFMALEEDILSDQLMTGRRHRMIG